MAEYAELTRLFHLAQQGDEDAAALFWKVILPEIRKRIVKRDLGDLTQLTAATNGVALRLFRDLQSLHIENRTALFALLAKMANREIVTIARYKKKKSGSLSPYSTPYLAQHETIADHLVSNEDLYLTLIDLGRAMDELSRLAASSRTASARLRYQRYLIILHHHFMSDPTPAEMQELLGLNSSQTRLLVGRARDWLTAFLEPESALWPGEAASSSKEPNRREDT